MTKRQEYILKKALEEINTVRMMLNDIMFRTDVLGKEEFNKVMDACDKIREADDILHQLQTNN